MKVLQILFAFLFFFQNAFSQKNFEKIIVLKSQEEKIDLYQYISTYTDSTKKQNFEEVQKIFKKELFVNQNDQALNFGIGDYNHWISFQIKNESFKSIEMVINSESLSLDEVGWFLLENDTLILENTYAGWQASYEMHSLPSRTHSVELNLEPKKIYTCFMKVNRQVGSTIVSVEILSKKAFYQKSLFQLIFILILTGAFFIMALIGLILYILTFQKLYIAYFLHILSFGFAFFYRFGIINMFHHDSPSLWLGPHGSFIFSSIWAATTVFFTISFLPVKKILSSMYLYIGYGFIATFIFILVVRFDTYLSKSEYYYFYFYIVLNILFILYILFRGLLINEIKSKIFIFSMSFLLLYMLYFSICLILGIAINNILFGMFGAGFFEMGVFCISLMLQFINFENNNTKLIVNLNKTQKELLNSEETERTRLAQDLHDDLGGTLSAIKGKVANEMQNSETLNLVEKAIEDLRSISRNLLPPELAKNGLSKAIQQSIDRLQSATLEFTFITFGNEKRMNNDRELNIYRVVSELLNNIVKHSKATKATVQVIFYEEYVHISVEDNGIGIKTEEKNWGIGLKNVNSRIEFLKAKLLKDSNENGTTFIIEASYI